MGYRYIGAKTNLVGAILAKVKELSPPGARIVDLMSGTGLVSAALRKEGFRVTAVDLMTFAFHHTRVALLLDSQPTFQLTLNELVALPLSVPPTLFPPSPYDTVLALLNQLPPRDGYFWKEFSPGGSPANGSRPRKYFTAANARRIDAIRTVIRDLREKALLSPIEHSLLLHDLIMAANDIANIAGTYGHYLSHFVSRASQPLQLRPSKLLILPDSGRHEVYLGHAEDLASSLSGHLCYIDPPYIKRQYAANYHVLETIAREDKPEAMGVSGLRPWRDQYSNFCSKTRIWESVEAILTSLSVNHVLISYSEDGLVSLRELRDFLSRFGKVEVSSLRHKRFKSNNSRLSPILTEYLVHLDREPLSV